MICWHCGQELATTKTGAPIFAEYRDPLGNTHKLHKQCAKHPDYKPRITAQASKGKFNDN